MVGRVEVVDVEVVGAQPLQAFVDVAQNGLARKPLLIGLFAHLEEHLAGDDELVALAFDGMTQHGFGDAKLIHVRGVEEVDARLDAAIYQLRRAGLIQRLAEGHGAETVA